MATANTPAGEELALAAANPYLKQLGFEEIDPMPLVAFTPQTTAWTVLFCTLALAAAVGAWRYWRNWQRNAYRREALAAIRSVREAAMPAAVLSRVIKSVALQSYGREAVARLSGAAWLRFLEDGHRHRFEALPESDAGRLLLALTYRAPEPGSAPEGLAGLCDYLEHWVVHHRTREPARA